MQTSSAVDENVVIVDYEAEDFDNYEDDRDLDYPTKGFSSIQEAIEDIREGKVSNLVYTFRPFKFVDLFIFR